MTDLLKHQCPVCGAAPGRPCFVNSRISDTLRQEPHKRRTNLLSPSKPAEPEWEYSPVDLEDYEGSIVRMIKELQRLQSLGFKDVRFSAGYSNVVVHVRRVHDEASR